MNESRSNAGVHTTRQTENDFIITNLLANIFHGLRDVITHHPVRLALANLMHKALNNGGTLNRMRHFWMKLEGIETALFISHTSNRARLGRGHQFK